MLAVEKGYYDVVKRLVEHGADVNLSNKHGDTPLMRAVRGGYFDIAEYLVKQGAHVSASWQGRTVQDCVEEGLRRAKSRIERVLGIKLAVAF